MIQWLLMKSVTGILFCLLMVRSCGVALAGESSAHTSGGPLAWLTVPTVALLLLLLEVQLIFHSTVYSLSL